MTDAPRYHVSSVGLDSPTEFLVEPLTLDLCSYDSTDLYAEVTRKVEKARSLQPEMLPSLRVHRRWVTWDWWNLHRAIPAEATGWRLLVRVTESKVLAPRTSNFVRAQSQVYVPVEFGW